MKREGEAPAEPNLSANREIGKSASREMAAIGDWRLANGEQRVANSKWRMVNEKPSTRNAQPQPIFTLYALRHCTLNSQPDFGANAPPTCQFHASRFTLPTHNFKRDMGQGTRNKTAAD
jgi:hypothetical protein